MDNINSLLIFDIWGKAAHFRKYYTNSSSLSYTFPPPPTIIGMIAGILGYERDSYYEEFNMENTSIAIAINGGLRKVMQTLNYVRTKSLSEFNGYAGHTQIPTEILVPMDERIIYRVYFFHRDPQIMNKLKKRLEEKRYIYPPYLGISEFLCATEYVDYIKKESIRSIQINDYVDLRTIINMNYLEDRGLSFKNKGRETLQYNKEKMVREFSKDRQAKEIANYIIEAKGKKISAKLNQKFLEIEYIDEKNNKIVENIAFL